MIWGEGLCVKEMCHMYPESEFLEGCYDQTRIYGFKLGMVAINTQIQI